MSSLGTCAVLAFAAGGMATTVAKAKIFLRVRMFVVRHTYYGGLLIQCPYCLSHWLVFAGAALYQPRLAHSNLPLVDVVVSAFATITVATVIAWLVCNLYWSGRD